MPGDFKRGARFILNISFVDRSIPPNSIDLTGATIKCDIRAADSVRVSLGTLLLDNLLVSIVDAVSGSAQLIISNVNTLSLPNLEVQGQTAALDVDFRIDYGLGLVSLSDTLRLIYEEPVTL